MEQRITQLDGAYELVKLADVHRAWRHRRGKDLPTREEYYVAAPS